MLSVILQCQWLHNNTVKINPTAVLKPREHLDGWCGRKTANIEPRNRNDVPSVILFNLYKLEEGDLYGNMERY
jgi:hypothetical protein